MASALAQAGELINIELQRIEYAIRGARRAATAEVPVSGFQGVLVFGLLRGRWSLFWRQQDGHEQHIVDRGLNERIAAVAALPALLEALKEARDERVREAVAAVHAARAIADALDREAENDE